MQDILPMDNSKDRVILTGKFFLYLLLYRNLNQILSWCCFTEIEPASFEDIQTVREKLKIWKYLPVHGKHCLKIKLSGTERTNECLVCLSIKCRLQSNLDKKNIIDNADRNRSIVLNELVKKLQHIVPIINLVSSWSSDKCQLHNFLFLAKNGVLKVLIIRINFRSLSSRNTTFFFLR